MHDEQFYRRLLDNLTDGVYFVDTERRITYWNQGAERISGFTSGQVIGRKCAENGLLQHVDAKGCSLCGTLCPLLWTMRDRQVREAQVYLHHAKGHKVPVLVRAHPIENDQGDVIGAVEVFSDNSSLLAALRRAEDLAVQTETDALTGVGNRRHVESRIEDAISDHRLTGKSSGVFFADVDHFKDVNDTHGHAVGDEALKLVAFGLRRALRTTDAVGRWGGDEFLGVALNLNTDLLRIVGEKLRTFITATIATRRASDPSFPALTVTVGGTLTRTDDTLASLMARMDGALYQGKAAGRDSLVLAP